MNGTTAFAQQQNYTHDIVERHAPLVKRIAGHLMKRLPASVQLDDLVQAGMIGLLEATGKYDETQGASFETYAGIRIRGSMLDEIRKNDWAPRSVHRKVREVAEAVRSIENEHGRDARDIEIAETLDMSLGEYYKLLQDNSYHKVQSVDDTNINTGETILNTISSNTPCILDGLHNDDLQRLLSEAIAGLPERERLLMSLYYVEELNLHEIGAVLGVSESRTSQIHGLAIIRLKARMSDHAD